MEFWWSVVGQCLALPYRQPSSTKFFCVEWNPERLQAELPSRSFQGEVEVGFFTFPLGG